MHWQEGGGGGSLFGELLGPLPRAERRPNVQRYSIWSIEEIRIFEHYEAIHVDDLHINMKIATHLPLKTN
jgi:hypothetical protein